MQVRWVLKLLLAREIAIFIHTKAAGEGNRSIGVKTTKQKGKASK